MSAASAGCVTNPEHTAGTVKPGLCLAGVSTAEQYSYGMATPLWCQLRAAPCWSVFAMFG